MHQIDRRIGLQQPPPGALPGVRLARHQQHAQPVPHAVDLDDGPVIEARDFARQCFRLQLDDDRPGTGDRQIDRHFLPDRHGADLRRLAIAAECKLCGPAGTGHPQILDRDPDGHVMPDQAEGRRLHNAQPAVGFLAAGRDQHMQRRWQRHRGRVVHLPIGERHDAGEARLRDIRQRPVDRGKELGSVMAAFLDHDGAQLQVRHPRGLGGQRRPGSVTQRGAVADLHRGRLVHDQQADVGQGIPCLPHQTWARKPQQQHAERQGTPRRPTRPAKYGRQQCDQAQRRECRERRPGQCRIEPQCGVGLFKPHWPSRSRMAGTWTWSPL